MRLTLFLTVLFLSLSTTSKGVQAGIGDDPAVIAEMSKAVSEIPAASILKSDRFMVWWKTIGDKRYVFKKRHPGLSHHEHLGAVLGARQNLSRFDEAQRIQSYIDKMGLTHIRIPGVSKVVFDHNAAVESDLTTGIVEEFLAFPDVAIIDHFVDSPVFTVNPATIPAKAYEELLQITTDLGLVDPHFANLKFDAATGSLWLTDIELINAHSYEAIQTSYLWAPLRPYLNWQLRQNDKVLGNVKLASWCRLPRLDRNDLALQAGLNAVWEATKKESIKLATVVILFKLGQYLYQHPYDTAQKIAFVHHWIDLQKELCPKCSLDLITREAVARVDQTEKREKVFELFASYHELLNKLENSVQSSVTLLELQGKLEDGYESQIDLELVLIDRQLKKLWGLSWFQNPFSQEP